MNTADLVNFIKKWEYLNHLAYKCGEEYLKFLYGEEEASKIKVIDARLNTSLKCIWFQCMWKYDSEENSTGDTFTMSKPFDEFVVWLNTRRKEIEL